MIAEYHEVTNAATGFVDMNFAPERIAKIVAKQGAALKARPEMKRHLTLNAFIARLDPAIHHWKKHFAK